MRKFFVLVKKEVKELLTPQMLVPMVLVVVVFVFVGKLMGSETKKASGRQPVVVADLDRTQSSRLVTDIMNKTNLEVKEKDGRAEELVAYAKELGAKSVVIIPEGFEDGIRAGEPKPVQVYSILNNFSFTGSRGYQGVSIALAAANEVVSNNLLTSQTGGTKPEALKHPIISSSTVVVGEREAAVSLDAVSGFIMSQTTFIPIILFLVITMSSQLIALSMATEKENKTLETLLSAPVDRRSVVAAKLVGAGLVALLNAVVYLFGMRYYFSGITGAAGQTTVDATTTAAISQLGLTFSTQDYVLLGVMLFLAILVALSIAVLLGAFAEDAKAVQGVTAPLMILVLIPYFLTLFMDISSLSPAMRWFVYAIPFSHAFLTAPNLMLGQVMNVVWGMAYLAAVFLVFVVLAARIFASDKILTMKLNFGKKKM